MGLYLQPFDSFNKSFFPLFSQFQDFDLESRYEGDCFDYVMFAGTESQLNKTNAVCGEQTGASLRSLSLISDGNYAVIKFVSDDKIAGAGYNAAFYSIPSGIYIFFVSNILW